MSSSPGQLGKPLRDLICNYNKSTDPNMLGIVKSARTLLKAGAYVGADSIGMNPLHYVAMFTECTALIPLLLEYGVELDACANNIGYTPLMYAIEMGHIAVALTLICEKANIRMPSKTPYGDAWWFPLGYAADRGHESLIPILLEHGAKLEDLNDPSNRFAQQIADEEQVEDAGNASATTDPELLSMFGDRITVTPAEVDSITAAQPVETERKIHVEQQISDEMSSENEVSPEDEEVSKKLPIEIWPILAPIFHTPYRKHLQAIAIDVFADYLARPEAVTVIRNQLQTCLKAFRDAETAFIQKDKKSRSDLDLTKSLSSSFSGSALKFHSAKVTSINSQIIALQAERTLQDSVQDIEIRTQLFSSFLSDHKLIKELLTEKLKTDLKDFFALHVKTLTKAAELLARNEQIEDSKEQEEDYLFQIRVRKKLQAIKARLKNVFKDIILHCHLSQSCVEVLAPYLSCATWEMEPKTATSNNNTSTTTQTETKSATDAKQAQESKSRIDIPSISENLSLEIQDLIGEFIPRPKQFAKDPVSPDPSDRVQEQQEKIKKVVLKILEDTGVRKKLSPAGKLTPEQPTQSNGQAQGEQKRQGESTGSALTVTSTAQQVQGTGRGQGSAAANTQVAIDALHAKQLATEFDAKDGAEQRKGKDGKDNKDSQDTKLHNDSSAVQHNNQATQRRQTERPRLETSVVAQIASTNSSTARISSLSLDASSHQTSVSLMLSATGTATATATTIVTASSTDLTAAPGVPVVPDQFGSGSN